MQMILNVMKLKSGISAFYAIQPGNEWGLPVFYSFQGCTGLLYISPVKSKIP